MGRGVSSGGGQSSLGYLFGSDEPPKPEPTETPAALPPKEDLASLNQGPVVPNQTPSSSVVRTDDAATNADIAAGKLERNPNNYHRADGQNTGNFITDRPSTKVHAAPGGGSSLGYLFGGGGK